MPKKTFSIHLSNLMGKWNALVVDTDLIHFLQYWKYKTLKVESLNPMSSIFIFQRRIVVKQLVL